MKKHLLKSLAALLCFALLLQQAGLPVKAKTVPGLEDEISEEERKEAEARAEAAHYQSLYDDLQKDLEKANAALDALLDEIAEVDRNLADAPVRLLLGGADRCKIPGRGSEQCRLYSFPV